MGIEPHTSPSTLSAFVLYVFLLKSIYEWCGALHYVDIGLRKNGRDLYFVVFQRRLCFVTLQDTV